MEPLLKILGIWDAFSAEVFAHHLLAKLKQIIIFVGDGYHTEILNKFNFGIIITLSISTSFKENCLAFPTWHKIKSKKNV